MAGEIVAVVLLVAQEIITDSMKDPEQRVGFWTAQRERMPDRGYPSRVHAFGEARSRVQEW